MSRKVALITGVTGQDGSYLAELLLSKGYKGLEWQAKTHWKELAEFMVDADMKKAPQFL
jgi:GDPmannose 4,6-dehydratase